MTGHANKQQNKNHNEEKSQSMETCPAMTQMIGIHFIISKSNGKLRTCWKTWKPFLKAHTEVLGMKIGWMGFLFVGWGCRTRMPQTRSLKQRRFIFSLFWRLTFRWSAQQSWPLVRTLLPVAHGHLIAASSHGLFSEFMRSWYIYTLFVVVLIYFWLHWDFIAAHSPSLVVAHGGYS